MSQRAVASAAARTWSAAPQRASAAGVIAATAQLGAPAQAAMAAMSLAAMPTPLSFDAKTIAGLLETLLVSLHDNTYVGAVERQGSIES